MRQNRILAFLLCAALLAGCSEGNSSLETPGAQVTPQPTSVPKATTEPKQAQSQPAEGALDGYSAFSLALLNACREEGRNTLLSPLSVTLALGMTANGSGGDTLREFEELFGLDLDGLNALCATLVGDYQNLGGSTEATLANSLWCDPDLTLKEAFLRNCTENYGADLYNADLQDPTTPAAVNHWCGDATRGLIPTIVDKFDDDAVLALVNAIYLKNAFAHPFKTPAREWEIDFHNADGTTAHPRGMHNGTRTETYIAAETGRGVVLPYDDGRLGLLVMLPDEDVGLDDFLAGLTGPGLSALLSTQTEALVNLTMPKFKTEWDGSLVKALQDMGLSRAFDPGDADFTAMGTPADPGEPLFIGDVVHKTAFEVNEKGTEAAAVTAVTMVAGSAMPPEDLVVLTLDRPFLYGIVDLELGILLFLGTVENL